MRIPTRLSLIALAAAAALPAAAQSNAEVLNELKALRERVNQLENENRSAWKDLLGRLTQPRKAT